MSPSRLLVAGLVFSGLLIFGAEPASAQALARADVNGDCTVTREDSAIVQAQLGRRFGQAGYTAAADVNSDRIINNVDLTFVTRNVGRQVCTTAPPAPTIVASVTPAANANGWHNGDVTVSFACTNAVSCPGAATVTTEGAAQVLSRTVANAAGATASAQVTLNIDKTAPVLTTPIPSIALPGAVVPVPVSATDLSGLASATLVVRRTIVDSETATPFGLTWTVPAEAVPGVEEMLEVFGEDRAGNVGTIRRLVAIELADATPPTVVLRAATTAPPGALIPLVVEAADNRVLGRVTLSRVADPAPVLLEDRAAGPFSFQEIAEIPAGLPAGTLVTFSATATDAAGNTAAAAATVEVVTSVPTTELVITVDPPVSPTFQTGGVITGTIGRASGTAAPQAPGIVADVAPQTGRQGRTVDIVITGVNTTFTNLSQVTLGPGVSVVSVAATDATHLTARLQIAPDASLGPRLVAVSTGSQEALLGSAFSVLPGLATLTGRLLNDQGQPIVNAQVCLEGTTTCVATGADGRFSFSDVPIDARRVVVTAPGYETTTLALALTPNGTATLGDAAIAVANFPPPPPLPNSPPVAPQLAVALGRGATEIGPGGHPEQLQRLVREAIIAVGGREIGVLDAAGQQLNPRMVGAGIASMSQAGVVDIANEMITGESITLAELFKILVGSLEFPTGVPLPTLAQLIAGFQQKVDQAWANPGSPDAALVMLLFNQGRVASVAPPRVNFDTRFNALQKNLLATSFVVFVHRFLNPPEIARLETAPAPARARAPGWRDRLRALAAWVTPRPLAATRASSSAGFAWSAGRGGFRPDAFTGAGGTIGRLPAGVRGGRTVLAQSPHLPGDTSTERPASLMWESVVSTVLPEGAWTAAKQGGKLCDKFLVQLATGEGFRSVDGKSPEGQQLAADPAAKFLPDPSCKDALSLLQILTTSGGGDAYKATSDSLGRYFQSENATAASARRLQQQYASASYQEAWRAAKQEAAQLDKLTKTVGVASSVAEGYLTKIQGEVIDLIFKLEVELVISSVRPRQPFITKVEQLMDPEKTPAEPSRLVKIWFHRSPNDKAVYDSPDIRWWYELYRGRNGAITKISGKQFNKADAELAFIDEVPDDGTYVYSVVGRRHVGYPITESKSEPSYFEKIVEFFAGFLPTDVSIGGKQVIGLDVVKTVTGPVADILKGINLQYSDPSDPEQIYVSTRPPAPRPPASLAVHPFNGEAYLSVPSLSMIYKITDGLAEPFVNPNFRTPFQAGLAIDLRGDLYTDNSASDAEFGGRLFSFKHNTGERLLVGTTNYYSQLITFANPVAVQQMLVAFGPYGEDLFIVDSLNQRITRLMLPWRFPPGVTTQRNVSQDYARSPLLQLSAASMLAMRPDLTLAVTQQNNVMLIAPFAAFIHPLFSDESGGTPSPFSNLTGITFDTYGNMYVADSVLGTISMIPRDKQHGFRGLEGLDAVDRKKLTVARGIRRPADLKLASDRDGLAFYDGERAFASLRFGMAGQITDQNGAPLSGATLYVQGFNPTVADGDGVFVLPNLVQAGQSPVVEFFVRYEGKTQSYSTVLDVFKHNVLDVVFNTAPPPPPPPDDDRRPVIPDPDPEPPIPQPSDPETIAVVINITAPTHDPTAESCPRGVFAAPAFGAGRLIPSVIASGMLTSSRFSTALLVVNGTATPVTLTDRSFSSTVALGVGENTLIIALPASVLKPLGCADPTLDDATPVSISNTHKVFHDTRADELERYRAAIGFDLAVRGIVREGGRPLAGLGFHVPGTDYEATTDGDGVFQINLPKGTLAGSAAAADTLATELFSRVGGIVALLRAERRIEAIEALQALLAQAIAVGETPPAAATTVDDILAQVLLAEGTARALIQALESPEGIPDPADVDALEALGQELAGLDANGEIVIRGREYPEISITVGVQ
jgi:hypothetical protein